MRIALTRCLVAFLMLAMLGGGMVRAEMLFAPAPCHDAGVGHAGHHHEQAPQKQDNALPCCIDCLGCASFTSGAQDPVLASSPLLMISIVGYLDRTADRGGRTLRPEPGPPRTTA